MKYNPIFITIALLILYLLGWYSVSHDYFFVIMYPVYGASVVALAHNFKYRYQQLQNVKREYLVKEAILGSLMIPPFAALIWYLFYKTSVHPAFTTVLFILFMTLLINTSYLTFRLKHDL